MSPRFPRFAGDLGAIVRALERALSVEANSYRGKNPSDEKLYNFGKLKEISRIIHRGPKIADALKNSDHSVSFSGIKQFLKKKRL